MAWLQFFSSRPKSVSVHILMQPRANHSEIVPGLFLEWHPQLGFDLDLFLAKLQADGHSNEAAGDPALANTMKRDYSTAL
ncbi:hypothetical protein HDU91_003857, partial [Kappamyces sp. JEL0680]